MDDASEACTGCMSRKEASRWPLEDKSWRRRCTLPIPWLLAGGNYYKADYVDVSSAWLQPGVTWGAGILV